MAKYDSGMRELRVDPTNIQAADSGSSGGLGSLGTFAEGDEEGMSW